MSAGIIPEANLVDKVLSLLAGREFIRIFAARQYFNRFFSL